MCNEIATVVPSVLGLYCHPDCAAPAAPGWGARIVRRIAIVAAGIALLAGPALASDEKDAARRTPEAYQRLIDCRAVADAAARLACYDQQVATIATQTAAGELVVTDRASMREARRGLFGFSLPNIGKLFGGGGDEDKAEEIKEIDTTIASARNLGYNGWRVTLADGSVWEQSDTTRLVFDPRAGNPIKIKQAAMGTYKANIDGQPAVRVRRVQ